MFNRYSLLYAETRGYRLSRLTREETRMRRKVKYIQPECLKRYEKAIKTSDMCVGLSAAFVTGAGVIMLTIEYNTGLPVLGVTLLAMGIGTRLLAELWYRRSRSDLRRMLNSHEYHELGLAIMEKEGDL